MVDEQANPLEASASETRRRLLQVAGEVFAEQGYHSATIRHICERAGANVAAINYHFGDKEKLYRQVVQVAHYCAIRRYPEDLHLPPETPPEKRLYATIQMFLLRLLDEGRPAWQGKLMAREMVDPTGALDQIIEQSIRPQFERLMNIVRDIGGGLLDDRQVRRCASSIIGQCLFYRHAQPCIGRLTPELRFDAAGLAELADHITRFSLQGIRGMPGPK